MSTAIKIISLEDSVKRRAEFARQASDHDIQWSFFDGYRQIASPLHYEEKAAKRRFGRGLSPSEIGCYTSHYKCWEWLAHSEYDQAIIFEDDVLVDWMAIKELTKYNFADYNIHFLRLFATHPFNWNIIKFRFLSPHYHLIRTKGICFGLQGYVLTKQAAKQLIAEYIKMTLPVDWVPTLYWEHKLANYSLFPFPVIEKHVPSTIGDHRHQVTTMTLPDRAIRFSWRIKDKIKRIIYDLTVERRPLGETKDIGPSFLTTY